MSLTNLAARLDRALKAAGVPIDGVSIADGGDKRTWRVFPASVQAQAQPIIDAFDPNDPAHEAAELNQRATASLDEDRAFSALLWTVIDMYSPPATRDKYVAVRRLVIDAYVTRPWDGL